MSHIYDIQAEDYGDADSSVVEVHSKQNTIIGDRDHSNTTATRTPAGTRASNLISPLKQQQQQAGSLTKLREAVSEGRRRDQQHQQQQQLGSGERKWFEGPITRSLSATPVRSDSAKNNNASINVSGVHLGFGAGDLSTASVSSTSRPPRHTLAPNNAANTSISDQRVIAHNLDVQLSVLFDQQNALFQRQLGDFETRITGALSKLDSRVGNIEDTVRSLERTSALEVKQLRMDNDSMMERLQNLTAERDALSKRLLAAQTANSMNSLSTRPGSPGSPLSHGGGHHDGGGSFVGGSTRGQRYKTPTGASSVLRNLVHQAGATTRGPVTGAARVAMNPQGDLHTQQAPIAAAGAPPQLNNIAAPLAGGAAVQGPTIHQNPNPQLPGQQPMIAATDPSSSSAGIAGVGGRSSTPNRAPPPAPNESGAPRGTPPPEPIPATGDGGAV